MRKRIVSAVMALILCLTLLPTAALAAESPTGITGDGTEDSPYQISTAEQLYAFAQWYNESAENLLENNTNTYAELTSNIDLNPNFIFTKDGCTGEGTPQEWKPIGLISSNFSSQLPYLGEFDGNGHTISGLYINESSTTEMAGGLFGYLAGYIHDVNLENSYINSKSACTGSFAGILEGKIENCTAKATVYSDANANELNGTGGIVGNLNGTTSEVLGCTFSGHVEAKSNPYMGGIVGENMYGYIADCTNNGTVTSSKWDKVGGIVGNNQIPDSSNEPVEGKSAVIERCVNNGAISGPNDNSGDYVGGIVGISSWSWEGDYFGTVRNCLNTGTITGCVSSGIVGYLEKATNVENCLNTGTISGTPSGGIAGQQLSSCAIKNSYYQEMDGLTAVGKLGGDGGSYTPADNEKISDEVAKATSEQITSGEIAWRLNTENGTKENSGIWSKNVDKLAKDFDVAKACKVIFDFPESTEDVIVYTSDDGKVEIPDAAKDKVLTYQKNGETKFFTEDTVVTEDITVTVAEKQLGVAPIFANNTDTISSADDKEVVFTLNSEPVDGTIFNIYSAETGGELVGKTSWSGTKLTVVLDSAPSNNTIYYVSMTTPTTTESLRSQIIVNAYVRPSSGGSSSGSSSAPTYPVTAPSKTENGSITVSPKNAKKGTTVTITVTPDKGYTLEALTVLDKDGKEIQLTKKNDIQYTFTMPASKVEVKATFVKEAEVSPFSDVSTTAYYYEAVKWAREKGITGGIGNGLFGPNQPCTRAQIVTFLWRAAGSPEPKNMSSFTDVPADSYYAKAVAWATENSITGGTGDGQFSPAATCTRAQSVTFLFRAIGKLVDSKAEFNDVLTDSYYANAVAWAVENGVTNGIGNGLFGPDNSCTRAQIVTFLYRA